MHVSLTGDTLGGHAARTLPKQNHLQVCHARNIHGRSLADIKAAARVLERIPALYPQLDASGLLQKGLPEAKQVRPFTFILLRSRTAAVDNVPLSGSTRVPGLYRGVLTTSVVTEALRRLLYAQHRGAWRFFASLKLDCFI